MKRVLLIASVLLIGIVVSACDTRPGTTLAPTATAVAPAPTAVAPAPSSKQVPEASSVDQNAPYIEACAREGLSDSACVGRLIWYKATGGNVPI